MTAAAAASTTPHSGRPDNPGNKQFLEISTESATVPSNAPSIQCPLDTAVKLGDANPPEYIHANRITIERPAATNSVASTDASKVTYIAGQSPQPTAAHFSSDATRVSLTGTGAPQKTEEWQKFLLEGITSGQGIFQFVSEPAHRCSIADDGQGQQFEQDGNEEKSKETPLIDQFIKAIEKSSYHTIELGKYTIGYFETEQTATHKRIMLWAATDSTGEATAIPLTQVGLRFANEVLQPEQIVEAEKHYDEHIKKIVSVNASAPPMVLSYAGSGRCATLIVYHEIAEQIKSGVLKSVVEVEAAMNAVIDQGKKDRGPGFAASPAQRDALLLIRHA